MLKIRLQRIGRKNDPSFRVVLTDSKNSTKSVKFLEILGTYNPKAGQAKFQTERNKYWIGKDAKPTDTMYNFMVSKKVIEANKKKRKHPYEKVDVPFPPPQKPPNMEKILGRAQNPAKAIRTLLRIIGMK